MCTKISNSGIKIYVSSTKISNFVHQIKEITYFTESIMGEPQTPICKNLSG